MGGQREEGGKRGGRRGRMALSPPHGGWGWGYTLSRGGWRAKEWYVSARGRIHANVEIKCHDWYAWGA